VTLALSTLGVLHLIHTIAAKSGWASLTSLR